MGGQISVGTDTSCHFAQSLADRNFITVGLQAFKINSYRFLELLHLVSHLTIGSEIPLRPLSVLCPVWALENNGVLEETDILQPVPFFPLPFLLHHFPAIDLCTFS